jgi:hypothetical protein
MAELPLIRILEICKADDSQVGCKMLCDILDTWEVLELKGASDALIKRICETCKTADSVK